MAQLDALRKIIREEVRAVFQEELAGILKEAIIANKNTHTIVESRNTPAPAKPPGTLNTKAPKLMAPILSPGNPLNSLLAETAQSMSPDDFGNLGEGVAVKDAPVVDSVDQMFSTARKSSNLEAIEINAVPDFSQMMSKMNI
jgi:hypothetical protein